jgi:hypothetical protein
MGGWLGPSSLEDYTLCSLPSYDIPTPTKHQIFTLLAFTISYRFYSKPLNVRMSARNDPPAATPKPGRQKTNIPTAQGTRIPAAPGKPRQDKDSQMANTTRNKLRAPPANPTHTNPSPFRGAPALAKPKAPIAAKIQGRVSRTEDDDGVQQQPPQSPGLFIPTSFNFPRRGFLGPHSRCLPKHFRSVTMSLYYFFTFLPIITHVSFIIIRACAFPYLHWSPKATNQWTEQSTPS